MVTFFSMLGGTLGRGQASGIFQGVWRLLHRGVWPMRIFRSGNPWPMERNESGRTNGSKNGCSHFKLMLDQATDGPTQSSLADSCIFRRGPLFFSDFEMQFLRCNVITFISKTHLNQLYQIKTQTKQNSIKINA
jgi:hypothetical protein